MQMANSQRTEDGGGQRAEDALGQKTSIESESPMDFGRDTAGPFEAPLAAPSSVIM